MSVLVTRSNTVSESVQDTVFCCLYMFDCDVDGLPCHTVDLSDFLLKRLLDDGTDYDAPTGGE